MWLKIDSHAHEITGQQPLVLLNFTDCEEKQETARSLG